MKKQVLPPGVKHGKKADFGAEMFGIGGDAPEGFRGGAKKDAVNHFLILPGNGSDAVRQGENYMEIRNRQKLCLMFFEPFSFGERLTLRAVPIPAGIVTDPAMAAIVALIDMTAESGGSAHFDCMHDLLLL